MVTNIHTSMKKILSFLSYHNAIPLAAVVLALGAGSAFAATNAGLLPLPSLIAPPVGSVIPTATESNEVDPSTLLSANLDTFDFRPTVTGVVETDSLYTVSYSISTLAPEGSEWAASSKTGEFSVEMDALDDTGLQGYVVAKLRDIESGERTYLSRAQAAEKALADARKARPANAFAALIGLALDQIFVPVVERPTPEPSLPLTSPAQPSHAETQPVPTAAASGTTSPENMATSTDATASGMASIATSTPVTTGDATSTDSSSMATTTPTNAID